jgi:hypothetical protein
MNCNVYDKQGVLGRTLEAYFPIVQISGPPNLLLLYLGNVSLYLNNKIQFR